MGIAELGSLYLSCRLATTEDKTLLIYPMSHAPALSVKKKIIFVFSVRVYCWPHIYSCQCVTLGMGMGLEMWLGFCSVITPAGWCIYVCMYVHTYVHLLSPEIKINVT